MSEYVHSLRVRYHECDPQGIVFNANYAMYVDVAMTQMWTDRFGSYANAVETHGADVVVGSITIDFRAPARPDDELDIALSVGRIGTTSIAFDFQIRRGDTTVAVGTIRYVCVDPQALTKTPVPAGLREVLLAA